MPNIILKIKDVNKDTYAIDTIGFKKIYDTDEENISVWVKMSNRRGTIDAPLLSSAFEVKQKGTGKVIDDAIGYMNNGGNNIYQNTMMVGLFSSCYSNGHGFSILPENFMKVVALFTARKTIVPNWINCKDEYLIPNTEHPDYQQWNNDCAVYSLFNNSSQQSSLRNIDYKDKKWDIINHFFFMSNEEMRDLANNCNFNVMYQDSKAFAEDRYAYSILQKISLSDDARAVLEAAREMMRKSMSMRKVYHENNPKYHLNAWDAGWAQLKPMFKEYFKEDSENFLKKYKEFEKRMREGVYKFGFLKE